MTSHPLNVRATITTATCQMYTVHFLKISYTNAVHDLTIRANSYLIIRYILFLLQLCLLPPMRSFNISKRWETFVFAFRDEGLGNLLVLRDILITYAAFHPGNTFVGKVWKVNLTVLCHNNPMTLSVKTIKSWTKNWCHKQVLSMNKVTFQVFAKYTVWKLW